MPMLMIEVAQKANQAGAATETMRNEIVKRMDAQTTTMRIDDAPDYRRLG